MEKVLPGKWLCGHWRSSGWHRNGTQGCGFGWTGFPRKGHEMINPIDTRVFLKEAGFSENQVVCDGCNHNIKTDVCSSLLTRWLACHLVQQRESIRFFGFRVERSTGQDEWLREHQNLIQVLGSRGQGVSQGNSREEQGHSLARCPSSRHLKHRPSLRSTSHSASVDFTRRASWELVIRATSTASARFLGTTGWWTRMSTSSFPVPRPSDENKMASYLSTMSIASSRSWISDSDFPWTCVLSPRIYLSYFLSLVNPRIVRWLIWKVKFRPQLNGFKSRSPSGYHLS